MVLINFVIIFKPPPPNHFSTSPGTSSSPVAFLFLISLMAFSKSMNVKLFTIICESKKVPLRPPCCLECHNIIGGYKNECLSITVKQKKDANQFHYDRRKLAARIVFWFRCRKTSNIHETCLSVYTYSSHPAFFMLSMNYRISCCSTKWKWRPALTSCSACNMQFRLQLSLSQLPFADF